jgi:hypothetical protein
LEEKKKKITGILKGIKTYIGHGNQLESCVYN